MRVGRYEIEGEIARGGMGAVFRARGPGGRPVAVKVLLDAASERARKRFLREGRALAKLRHPHLVAVHEVGESEAGPYLVMELVDGVSLQARLVDGETLTPAEAVRVGLGLADALEHCHRAGVIHRDVKPGNVLITPDGEPCLTDFGLAHDADPELSRLSKSGTYIGSPGFWPPEQATGDLERLGPWSDVFGLGATLHAALTGEPPFDFDSMVSAVIAALEQEAHTSGVDRHLDALIADCLLKDPARRPTLTQVVERLAAWSPSRAAPAARLDRWAVWGVALGVLVLTGAAAAFLAVRNAARPVSTAPPIPCVVAPWEAELPPAAWRLLQKGRAAFRAGRLDVSAATYLEAERLAPKCARLHALRAVSLSRQDKKREALKELDQAVALDPDDAQVRYNRGATRCELGDAQGAIEDLDRVLAKMPDKANAWHARGAANYQLGRYDQSIADHDRAAAIQPRLVVNLISRAAARVAKGDLRGALKDYDKALTIRPKHGIALGERGRVKLDLGDTSGALDDIDAALALRPNDPLILSDRGRALMKSGDLKGAVKAFSAALKLRPKDAGLLEGRGVLRYKLGDRAGAIDDLERADALLPAGHKLKRRVRLLLSKFRAPGG